MDLDDDAYRNKIAIAIYEAVVTASRGDADAAVIRTGSSFDALLMVASLLIAGSPEVDTAARRSCSPRAWQRSSGSRSQWRRRTRCGPASSQTSTTRARGTEEWSALL